MLKKKAIIIGISLIKSLLWSDDRFDVPESWENVTQEGDLYVINLEDGAKIKFPVNGNRPDMRQAANWGCATSKSEAVSAFYQRAFLMDKIGFNEKPIITITGEHVEELKRAFDILSTNPVGRTLLYYDLIEIRRRGTIEDKEDWVPENINDYVTDPDYSKYISAYLTVRNENRSVTLTDDFSEQYGYYSPVKRQLSCTTKATPYPIFKKIKEEDLSGVNLETHDRPYEVTLFHEILHWSHALANPFRFLCEAYSHIKDEIQKDPSRAKPYQKDIDVFLTRVGPSELFAQYFSQFNDESAFHEFSGSFCKYLFSVDPSAPENLLIFQSEELRTIWGEFKPTKEEEKKFYPLKPEGINLDKKFKYQNGDDISENTYLCSIGKRMRASYYHIYTETGSIMALYKFNEETGMNEIVADPDSNPLTYELVSYVARKAYADIIGQPVEEVKWEWLEPESETTSTPKASEKL